MNAYNERFNRTLQEQFVDYYEDLLFTDINEFNKPIGLLVTIPKYHTLHLISVKYLLENHYECYMYWTYTLYYLLRILYVQFFVYTLKGDFMRYALALLIVPFLFLGCAPTTSSFSNLVPSSLKKQDKKAVYQPKDYSKKDLIKEYEALAKQKKDDDLIWDYETGTLAYLIARYPKSIHHFDSAEKLIKTYDEEVLAGKLLANIGSMLTNDTFMDYRPKIYEKIMVNTYKGVDYLILKDNKNARVEFNRALVRQQRAKSFFAKEINQEKQKLKKEKKSKKKKKKLIDVNKIIKNKQSMAPIEKYYSNLFAFKPYHDFVNPFTTYLAGIYFFNVKDYRKATNLLKEAYGMIKGLDNGYGYVRKDFQLAFECKRSLSCRKRRYTWVIFFNGEGPTKEEVTIHIPVFLFSNDVFYTGLALPTLKMRKKAFAYLRVNGLPTKRVASMDTIIKAEFKKRFNTILTRAILRSVTQTLIQKRAKDVAGFFGGIAGTLYQASMNKADVRMWKSLPKEFQVARVPTKSRLIITTPSKKRIASIKTNPRKNYIVFVTIRSSKSEPIIGYRAF